MAKGSWDKYFKDAEVVIMLQAEIGALDYKSFKLNTIDSTKNVINVTKKFKIPYLIHESSAVVNSSSINHYTNSKIEQESLVLNSKLNYIIFRPSLMFGLFDRKHLV